MSENESEDIIFSVGQSLYLGVGGEYNLDINLSEAARRLNSLMGGCSSSD